MENDIIKIGIIDDHPLYLNGLEDHLERENNMSVVVKSSDCEEFLELAKTHKPNLAMIDIKMPKMNGIEVLKELKKTLPEIKAIALSNVENPQYLRSFLQAGGNGYMVKGRDHEKIVVAINVTMINGNCWPDKLQEVGLNNLTLREIEILKLICHELTSEEIAEHLYISVSTVKTHRESLMKKTGSRSVAGMVRYAIENGLD